MKSAKPQENPNSRDSGDHEQRGAERVSPDNAVSIRRTRQEQFVVTAFMRSFAGFRCTAPMNRGTTNGLGEYLHNAIDNSFPPKYLGFPNMFPAVV